MIEPMIKQLKEFLPLEIKEILWDGTVFQIIGNQWNFTTLSSWRVTTDTKMVFGCFDNDSEQLIKGLENTKVLDLDFQSSKLKIDPVFILSNSQKIEIFSTDTFEPWTFHLKDIAFFVPTPCEPENFTS